jgi:hypothetical protein
MNQIVTHITKTLALLAVLLLPVQRSMAATCCCQRGINQSSLESSTDSPASCCSQQSSSPCCCQTSGADSDSQPCRCPSGCRCTTLPDAIVFSAESSSEWNFSADIAPSISANVCQNEQRCSRARADVSSNASGSTLCVQLCRYQL